AALGFYFSGHPFAAYRKEIGEFVKGRLVDLTAKNEPMLIAGVVAEARTQMTRRGKMGVVTLDDGSATIEVTVYSEFFEASREMRLGDEWRVKLEEQLLQSLAEWLKPENVEVIYS